MHKHTWLIAGALALATTGCPDDNKQPTPAPKASTLKDTKPKAKGAHEFELEKTSKVTFAMDAPNEKIRGNMADATRGKLQIPLDDVTKTTGHLYVDLGKLVVGQQKPNDDGKFEGDKWEEIPLQNEHAKEWLQISCVKIPADKQAECEATAKKNRNVEFVIEKVEADHKDVTKLKGDTRKITATVSGNFLLHQVPKKRSAKVEITFKMKGEEPVSVAVKTVEPFAVKLSEHEVGPNDVFGKFAKNTLQTLDQFINEHKKVAEAAEISLDFTAKFAGMAKPSGSTAPASSPKAAPSAAGSAEK